MKYSIFSAITLLLLLSPGTWLHAGEPARGDLDRLIDQIQQHPDGDFSKFIGKVFEFEGELVNRDRRQDKVVKIEIWTGPRWARGAMVDSKVVATVIMPDPSKVLRYPAGGIGVHSEGVLQSVDPKTKTFVIKSENTDTYVTEAD